MADGLGVPAVLLSQRTRVWFTEPTQEGSQAPVTPAPGYLTPSSGLPGNLHTHVHTLSQIHTYT